MGNQQWWAGWAGWALPGPPAGVSCSRAALMINGTVENSSLGLFFFPELKTRFRSSQCPQGDVFPSVRTGGLHPHLDGCLTAQVGRAGTGQPASPHAQAYLLWGEEAPGMSSCYFPGL